MPNFSKHSHGGQLNRASQRYGITLADWLDLSTGISPFTYPLPSVPDACWQRLPESNDGLEKAAAAYYGSEFLLPVAGSQQAIAKIPLLFAPEKKVGIITPAYHSHQQAWEKAGHEVVLITPEQIENTIDSVNVPLDILLLVNPTNPSTQLYSKAELSKWHQQLAANNGYLIVDEAFIDSTPKNSLIETEAKSGLIVLRSIGKFFGLAGIRLGFVWAETEILQTLAMLQEDWSVSNPARWAGRIALADKVWQQQQRHQLSELSLRLQQLLHEFLTLYPTDRSIKSGGVSIDKNKISPNSGGMSFNNQLDSVKHTALFAYFEHPDAPLIHQSLAQQGILTRLFIKSYDSSRHTENALRFGLPTNQEQWQRLEKALLQIATQNNE